MYYFIQRLFITTVLLLSSVSLLNGQDKAITRSISLSETAYVEVKPDLAIISLEVMITGRNASQIEEEAYQKSKALVKVFESYTLAEEDYQSTQNSMYDQRWREQEFKQVRMGYEVTFRALGDIEAFRKDVVEAGATVFRIDSYENSNASIFTQKAAEKALKQAMQQAEILATVAGMQLGDPISLQLNRQYIRPSVATSNLMMRTEASDMKSDRESTSNKTVIRYQATMNAQFEIYKK